MTHRRKFSSSNRRLASVKQGFKVEKIQKIGFHKCRSAFLGDDLIELNDSIHCGRVAGYYSGKVWVGGDGITWIQCVGNRAKSLTLPWINAKIMCTYILMTWIFRLIIWVPVFNKLYFFKCFDFGGDIIILNQSCEILLAYNPLHFHTKCSTVIFLFTLII